MDIKEEFLPFYIIPGQLEFSSFKYSICNENNKQTIEIVLYTQFNKYKIIFSDATLHFRYRTVHVAMEYFYTLESKNSHICLYHSQYSPYMSDYSKIESEKNYAVHYLIFDYIYEYYFDIISETKPQIIKQKLF